MLCVSECPTDALQAGGFSLLAAVAGLKKASDPVLGCASGGEGRAHEKAPCLGLLSEEHLIALCTLPERPLQLNLTGCAECKNGFTLPVLKQRIKDIGEKTPLDVTDRVTLVEERSALRYGDVSYDRRGFFSALRSASLSGASAVIEGLADRKPSMSFSRKTLPVKRMLLNSVLSTGDGAALRESLLRHYFHDLSVDGSCNFCFACVGVCPSGAIMIDRERPGDGVMFNASLCSGCALCEGFCMSGSIAVRKGFQGADPFEFRTAGGRQESDG
jgi:ferredoxin